MRRGALFHVEQRIQFVPGAVLHGSCSTWNTACLAYYIYGDRRTCVLNVSFVNSSRRVAGLL